MRGGLDVAISSRVWLQLCDVYPAVQLQQSCLNYIKSSPALRSRASQANFSSHILFGMSSTESGVTPHAAEDGSRADATESTDDRDALDKLHDEIVRVLELPDPLACVPAHAASLFANESAENLTLILCAPFSLGWIRGDSDANRAAPGTMHVVRCSSRAFRISGDEAAVSAPLLARPLDRSHEASVTLAKTTRVLEMLIPRLLNLRALERVTGVVAPPRVVTPIA